MPNLFLIKSIAEKKKIPIIEIAEVGGLTPQGLHGAINKGDIKFSYLDKIAHFLQVDLAIFSDFSEEKMNRESISVGGNNSGNIAGGNLLQVSLPEVGYQKIINSDGTTIIEPILPNIGYSASDEKNILLEKIGLQEQLIESLKDQLRLYKEKYE